MKEMSKDDARIRAEQAFRQSGLPFVDNYSVEAVDKKDDKQSWRFFFRGAGERERPGYHATVVVNKTSGKTQIIPGE